MKEKPNTNPATQEADANRACAIIKLILWLFVIIVAAIDVYFAIKLQDSLIEHELNPIGRMLINIDNGSVALFMALKFFGTVVALSAVPIINNKYGNKWALIYIIIAATIQMCLLYFLIYGHMVIALPPKIL
jgi:hypothetical protein